MLTKILFTVIIISSVLFAQYENPDGESPSIHLTPHLQSGSYSIRTNTLVDTYNFDDVLNFNVKIKVPMDHFTISPYFESFSKSYKFSLNGIETKYEENIYRYGFTISYYF